MLISDGSMKMAMVAHKKCLYVVCLVYQLQGLKVLGTMTFFLVHIFIMCLSLFI